jgi:hypothetical protein
MNIYGMGVISITYKNCYEIFPSKRQMDNPEIRFHQRNRHTNEHSLLLLLFSLFKQMLWAVMQPIQPERYFKPALICCY